MSKPAAGNGFILGAPEERQSLQETLQAWRDWIHLEAARERPYGKEAPTLVSQVREQREHGEAAARALLGLALGRVDPVETTQLQGLLLELAARSDALRARLAAGEVIRDAPLCGLLATQIAGCIALLWFLVGRGTR